MKPDTPGGVKAGGGAGELRHTQERPSYKFTANPTDNLLGRLDRVQSRGPGQWFASCPTGHHAKGDRSRGLSIREASNGAVLIHCFGGCSAAEVVGAVGLNLSDLFPPRDPERRYARGAARPRIDWRSVFDALELDLLALALAAGDLAEGVPLESADAAFLASSATRLAATVREVRHGWL